VHLNQSSSFASSWSAFLHRNWLENIRLNLEIKVNIYTYIFV